MTENSNIVIVGNTTSAPYEIDIKIDNVLYTYGADYAIIQKCLFIDKQCRRSGKRALNFIKKASDYCLKFKEKL